MANKKGINGRSKHPIRSMTASTRTQSADQKENARVAAVASKAKSLSDPLSDIRDTDYWMCKPKKHSPRKPWT